VLGHVDAVGKVAHVQITETAWFVNIKIPNEFQRKHHILHNMLFMSEISPVNVELCKEIFLHSKVAYIFSNTSWIIVPKVLAATFYSTSSF
jgi:hypothetical protein